MCDRSHEERVGADEDVLFDHGGVLVCSVEVARDRPRANVDVFADLRVAQVGEVPHLCVGPERAVLHLAEVADVRAFAHARAFAQVAERADVAVVLHHGVFQHRCQHVAAVADGAAFDDRVRADGASFADGRFPAQVRVRLDDRILPDGDVRPDVRRRRIDDGDTGEHPAFVDALAQRRLRVPPDRRGC